MQCTPLKKAAALICLVSLFAGTSCKKDKKEEPQLTRKELLSNSWKVVDVKTAEGTSVIGLPFPEVQCLKDNIVTLSSDNSFTLDEGDVVCEPPMEAVGTWNLIENETKLNLVAPGEAPLVIELVDVTVGKFSFKYVVSEGIAQETYTIELQKI